MRRTSIPLPVAAIVNDVLAGSHSALNAVFQRAKVPGEPPNLSHASKWKVWLLRANDADIPDPLAILGRVIEEFMEVEPSDLEVVERWRRDRQRLEDALARYGCRYVTGGRVISTAVGPASNALGEALHRRQFSELEIEFERALASVESDPGAAVTAASAILEALFKAYIEAKSLALPDNQSIKPLWSVVQKELGLDPKSHVDQDVQKVLSGMTSVVDGVGSFRTHAGSAHGGGKHRYKIRSRHARLMVSSAHALATFLIETWEEREPPLPAMTQ